MKKNKYKDNSLKKWLEREDNYYDDYDLRDEVDSWWSNYWIVPNEEELDSYWYHKDNRSR